MLSLKSRRTLFVLFSFLALFGISAFVFFRFFFFQQESQSVQEYLQKADNFISSGYFQEAERLIARAFAAVQSDEVMLRVLKRSFLLSEKTENTAMFLGQAKKAAERYPGNKQIQYTALYAMLRTGALEECIRRYADSPETRELQGVLAEAYLRMGKDLSDTELSRIPQFQEYFTAAGEYTPGILTRLAETFKDNRYALDAMLLYLKNGEIEPAYRLSLKMLSDYDYDEPAGLAAYDYGKWDEAKVRLSRINRQAEKRTDLELILGDIDISVQKYDQAKERFDNAIEYDPLFSPNSYLNYATILQRQGFSQKARYLLEKAYSVFPESVPAGVEYAKLLFHHGEQEKAQDLVAEMQKQYPENTELGFLRLSFVMASTTQDIWIENLHNYFQENPEDERAAEILMYAFLRYRHLDRARRIITAYSEASGESEMPWAMEAEGIISALDGNVDAAGTMLEKAVRGLDRWDFHYNYAVILVEQGRLEDALAEATAAGFIISSGLSPGGPMIARVLSLQAEIKIRQGRSDDARALLQKALEHDATNPFAWELVKMLEARK
ncbi:MAG: tetratricopeptide repeat protein [Spirochaetales bacterium]|nr:tetratricopeptide repeat protein [Spirochaetales bacterium]